MDQSLINRFLKETKLVSGPKRLLAAYGNTQIRYHLVSSIDGMREQTRLREGMVISERPLILTAEALKERFEGFGEDAIEFTRWLYEEYKDILRALEYKFRNQDFKARVLKKNVQAVTRRIQEDISARSLQDNVLIRCPDAAWSLALMKFTLDEAARAIPSHIKTYEEHGLFDPGAAAVRRRKREIEELFSKAASHADARARLGRRLKEYGVFEEYEDRFLSLFR